ncbi:LytR/AlgR family response regulator transcription factor [Puia dinghuensis]|uniref:DNA-binding response regulator n=1 Tax=Puia dinghuensis TaxID=1792502 RepID=A0A8J2U7R8_9BACT|nr:response regulator transcription factor [Puia dinghuensis]GGA84835.1 DNA-binding response regulator [Puia dinghuensis]
MIVDDEPNAVNLLEVLIGQSTSWQLVTKCYHALEAIAFLKENAVDLIFLDINMPLLTGMELAGLLSSETAIVFTTAYSEHAAESYSFNTIDYLLKPITLKRFLTAVKKAETHFQSRMPVTGKEEKANEYFFVKSGTELRKIFLPEILFFESRKEYVRVVTRTFEVLTYRRLKDIEAQLSMPFARVHNSYIINISQMNKIQDNHIHIGDIQVPIGEKFRDGLMEVIRKKTF